MVKIDYKKSYTLWANSGTNWFLELIETSKDAFLNIDWWIEVAIIKKITTIW